MDKVVLGQVFLPVIRCSPVNIVPPMLHTYSSSSTCCCYQKEKGAEPGNLPKSSGFSELGSVGLKGAFTYCVQGEYG